MSPSEEEIDSSACPETFITHCQKSHLNQPGTVYVLQYILRFLRLLRSDCKKLRSFHLAVESFTQKKLIFRGFCSFGKKTQKLKKSLNFLQSERKRCKNVKNLHGVKFVSMIGRASGCQGASLFANRMIKLSDDLVRQMLVSMSWVYITSTYHVSNTVQYLDAVMI